MRHLSIDLETFSSVKLGRTGLYKYVQSPDFQILLLAWSLDGSPVQLVDLAQGETIPPLLWDALWDAGTVKHAFNAAFEWYCLSQWTHVKNAEAWLSQWRCTMLHSQYCGYPSSLDAAAKTLCLTEQKDSKGSALIRFFCQPCTPTGTNGGRVRNYPWHDERRWELFKSYCRQDVATEMEVEKRLARWPVPADIQRQWELDQRINTRGAALDIDLIDGALALNKQQSEQLLSEARQITGLSNPNSTQQLLAWLKGKGVSLENLQAQTVEDALTLEIPADARRVLVLRQESSKASLAKYRAMREAVCDDGRVRGLLKFYGASKTGRWAGQIIQPQNLPRTHLDNIPAARELVKARDGEAIQLLYGSVPNVLSQLIRTAFVPSPGKHFVDADFSAIEARVIAWLSGEQWRLNVFRTHGKIYEASAAAMFKVPIESIAKGKENYSLRAKGKVAELALGYQGGSQALIAMGALRMGLTEEELPELVKRWRGSNKNIVGLWRDTENAALETVRTGRQTSAANCLFRLEDGEFLTVTLPSQRKLFYARPFLTENRFGAESLAYMGINQQTRQWGKQETYGGRLVENITQAVARDCLALAIERLEAAGFPIVFHIHDEVVIEGDDLDRVTAIMREPPPWAPDLPLDADGWVGDYFTKE